MITLKNRFRQKIPAFNALTFRHPNDLASNCYFAFQLPGSVLRWGLHPVGAVQGGPPRTPSPAGRRDPRISPSRGSVLGLKSAAPAPRPRPPSFLCSGDSSRGSGRFFSHFPRN